jgi:hypothetical protein
VQPTLAASNGIEIAYETFGAPDSRPLLLVTLTEGRPWLPAMS